MTNLENLSVTTAKKELDFFEEKNNSAATAENNILVDVNSRLLEW